MPQSKTPPLTVGSLLAAVRSVSRPCGMARSEEQINELLARNEWETLDHIRDWETKLMAQNVMPQGDPSKDEVLRRSTPSLSTCRRRRQNVGSRGARQ